MGDLVTTSNCEVHSTQPNVMNSNCGSRKTLDLIADTWTILVLAALKKEDVLRFSELKRMIEGISKKMLTQTLRKLERDGLVHREVYAVVPPKTEYSLTPLGQTLQQAVKSLYCWAEEYYPQVEEAREYYLAKQQL